MIDLQTSLIQDDEVRKVIDLLVSEINKSVFSTRSVVPFGLTLKSAVTAYAFPHHLGFTPKDILLTFQSAGVDAQFHHDSFDRENIYLTTAGPGEIRGLVGRLGDD